VRLHRAESIGAWSAKRAIHHDESGFVVTDSCVRRKIMNKILAFVLAIVLNPATADAQSSGKIPRVAFLAPQSRPTGRVEAFRLGLRDLGYIDGQNIKFEYRGHEDRSQLIALATELVRDKVEVIVTQGGATRVAQTAGTVPIVFGFSGDPVEAGLVKSLARPGGHMTGITMLAFELVGKRLEALKEVVPKVSRVAVLSSPAHPGEQRELSETQRTARNVGVTLLYHQVSTTADVNAALDATTRDNANALLAFPDPVTSLHRVQIAEYAVKQRIPSVFGWSDYVDAGGLMSYGPDHNALWRRVAVYVDKILKGAKPADLPVEQPTKFELVINLKTAQQISLAIPPAVLARADRVIK
jgi:putative tryptophan/tyrosine transport system substrate-binding protein